MADPLVHPGLTDQQSRNRASRELWQCFAPHRQRVTELIVGGVPPDARSPRLTILGAGNCNDLDLARLRQRFDAIQLVDCDLEAVQQGIQRQGLTVDPAITLLGPVDLSGIADQIQSWSPDQPPSAQEIDRARTAAASAAAVTSFPPSNVVASVCLLSQILERLILALGPEHPRLLELVHPVRHAHLRLMIDQLYPGGIGLLITDVVSSETAPQIVEAQPLTLPGLLRELIARRNFFTGLNPAVIHSLLTTDPLLVPHVEQVAIHAPWIWDLGSRVYAVYAAQFRRRPSDRETASAAPA
jgi:hypothetical protein